MRLALCVPLERREIMSGADNALEIALQQLDEVAERINLDPAIHKRLRLPARCYIVSCPVRMDDGSVEVFTGYRVHHNTSSVFFSRLR